MTRGWSDQLSNPWSDLGSGSGNTPLAMGCRLSPSAGTPIILGSNPTVKSQVVYLVPYLFPQIPLYTGTQWSVKNVGNSAAVTLPTTKYRIYDIFASTGGTSRSDQVTLSYSAWTQPGGSITIAAVNGDGSIWLQTSPAHGLTTGDRIAVYDMSTSSGAIGTIANNVWCVRVDSSNQITLLGSDMTGGGLTSTGTWVKLNVTAPSRGTQDSVVTDISDPKKLYLGTVMTWSDGKVWCVTNQPTSTNSVWGVWNRFHRVPMTYVATPNPINAIYTGTSWRLLGRQNTGTRHAFCCGLTEDPLLVGFMNYMTHNQTRPTVVSFGFDRDNNPDGYFYPQMYYDTNGLEITWCTAWLTPPSAPGFHMISLIELGAATNSQQEYAQLKGTQWY